MGLAIRVSPPQINPIAIMNDGVKVIRRRFSYKDFNAASTTSNNDTIILPGGCRITKVWIGLITAFSGGSVSAATLSIGTTSSATTYLGATNVFTGATAGGAITMGAGAGLGNFAGGNGTPNALGTVRCQVVTTTDNAVNLSAGKVDVFIEVVAVDTRTT
jgi:hypothetical protein